MLIRVKSLNGRIIEINIDNNSSIKEIKQSIADKEGIPTGIFFLVYEGRALKEDKFLSDYPNITKNSLLSCVVNIIVG